MQVVFFDARYLDWVLDGTKTRTTRKPVGTTTPGLSRTPPSPSQEFELI
jgi:hypothetical protein